MTHKEAVTNNVVVHRLSQEVYGALVKKVASNRLIVTNQTTELQAGFMLGIQHVLDVLRQEGVVYGGN